MGWDLTLVTGGGGFLGGHLVGALRAAGVRVRAVDRKPLPEWQQRFDDVENVCLDLHDGDACLEACREVVNVYDLADDTGGAGFRAEHAASCMLSARIGTQLLLAARERRVRRFLFASSASVAALDGGAARGDDDAALAKLFVERLCRNFARAGELQTRIARYHSVYGPRAPFTGGREHAPAAICRKVQEAVASGSDVIEIAGDGTERRSFLYVDDCVAATLALMKSPIAEPSAVGSGVLVPIDELVTIVEEIAGVRLQRRYLPAASPRPAAAPEGPASPVAEPAWQPAIGLREGLRRTYEWIAAERAHAARAIERTVMLPRGAAPLVATR